MDKYYVLIMIIGAIIAFGDVIGILPWFAPDPTPGKKFIIAGSIIFFTGLLLLIFS